MESNITESLHESISNGVKVFVENRFGINAKYEIRGGAKGSDSYISDIFRIIVNDEGNTKGTKGDTKRIEGNTKDIEGDTKDKEGDIEDTKKCRKFILKIIKPSRVSREVGFIKNSFTREIAVYEKLFREYSKLENKFGVHEPKRFKHVEVFKTSTDEGREFLIMEDLYDIGFKMMDRYKPLDKGYILLILRDLAKVHALSFAFKAHEPDVYYSLLPKITCKLIPEVETYIKLSNQKAIDLLDGEGDKVKLANFLKANFERIGKISEADKMKNPYNVLCHADCWINNFMFKCGVEKNIPEEVMILDWQVMALSSPLQDVLHLIFLTTDVNFRRDNYTNVIEYYYAELENNLKNFDLSINDVYPRNIFENDQKLILGTCLSFAIGGLPFVLSEQEDKLTLDDVYGDDIDYSKVIYTDLIVKRLKDVISDVLNII